MLLCILHIVYLLLKASALLVYLSSLVMVLIALTSVKVNRYISFFNLIKNILLYDCFETNLVNDKKISQP